MKRYMRALSLVLVLALLVSSGAAASVRGETSADALAALGLFRGTDKGYELTRAPTRTEAAVMLVRLLGCEEEARAGARSHPFRDVAPWAQDYIAYMYEKGLTRGMSETRFGAGEPCSAQMYVTMVLRALGYDEGDGDFTYQTALAFAASIGLCDETLTDGVFLRGNLAAVSENALLTQVKSSDDVLLNVLRARGAVDEKAAAAFLSAHAALLRLNEAFADTADGFSGETTLSRTASRGGVSTSVRVDGTLARSHEGAHLDASLTAGSVAAAARVWERDGTLYLTRGGENTARSGDALSRMCALFTPRLAPNRYAALTLDESVLTVRFDDAACRALARAWMALDGAADETDELTRADVRFTAELSDSGAPVRVTVTVDAACRGAAGLTEYEATSSLTFSHLGEVEIAFPDALTFTDSPLA